jgi:hypothetical protein
MDSAVKPLLIVLLLTLAMAVPAWAQAPARNNPSDGETNGRGQMATGALPFDPSKNVLDLVQAGKERQDDLRNKLQEGIEAQLRLINQLSEMRSQHDRELLQANTSRLDSEAKLRSEFSAAIAATEKARVDAIRLVDTQTQSQAGLVATQTAANLAKTVQESAAVLSQQVNTSAEALRNLVATTAAESSRNIQQQFGTLGSRVAALEQGSAQGIGERKFSDPAVAAIAEQVRMLVRDRNESLGVSTGSSATWGIMLVVGTLAVGLVGVIIAFVTLSRKVAKNGRNGPPEGG